MPHKFCCCCHLRTSSIALAWLQVMGCLITMAAIVSPLDLLLKVQYYYYFGHPYSWNENMNAYLILQPIFALLFVELIIKSITCFALIWGIVQRKHLYMQPWIFLTWFENVILTLVAVAVFIAGIVFPPVFIGFVPVIIFTGLGWYFLACVNTVYKQDYIQSSIYWQEYSLPLLHGDVDMTSNSVEYHNERERNPYQKNYHNY